MKLKKREQIFRVVKQCVDEWNPYQLLPEAPNDEFDRESRAVASKLELSHSTKEIAKIVSTVFCSAFESKSFPQEHCMEVAEKIMQGMKNTKGL